MMIHIYKVYRAAAGTLLLTAALAACTDDSREPMQENETPREGIFFSVTATQGEGAETRVNYTPNGDQGMDVTWAANDKIYVGKLANRNLSTDNLSTLTLKQGDEGGTTAQFTGDVNPNHLPASGETLYAFYGKVEKIEAYSRNFFCNYDGQRQIANKDMAHLADYDFMTASTNYTPGTNHHFSFSHLGSMMKFTLGGLGGKTVKKLTLKPSDGGYLFAYSTTFVNSISLDLGADSNNGISIESDGRLEAYLMVGATIETAGRNLVLSVTTADGKNCATLLTGAEIAAGKIYTVDATLTEYSIGLFQGAGTPENPYQINTAGDLSKLALMTNMGWIDTKGKHFRLTRDIDLAGEEAWMPIGGTANNNNFEGTFTGANGAGGNYSITNLPGKRLYDKAGLFGGLSGATIKNVTVNGVLTLNFGNIGGIAGFAKNSIIENCISKCTISTEDTGGGIIGYSEGDNNVVNCRNEGAITGPQCGGIISYALGNGTITGCTNSGNIISTSDVLPGGIIGYLYLGYDESFTLTNCTHSGSKPTRGAPGSIIGEYNISYGPPPFGTITIANSEGNGTITGSESQDVIGQWPEAQ